MENIIALSLEGKANLLSRRLNKKVTSVRALDALKALIQRDKKDPKLILIDVSLPSLSGADLIEWVRNENKNMQLVLVSDLTNYSERSTEPKLKMGYKAKFRTELHNPKSGRIDAIRVAEFFGISLSQLARILRLSPQSVHKTPDSVRMQKKLGNFVRVAAALLELFETQEKSRYWLNTPNPELDNLCPIEIIKKRKVEIITDMVEDLLLGHPG